ncbi:MAG: hypothetical protein SFZ03_09735 [Candidatus Melainabacteria bacterium]|nr:hypothetical protein [Candidatus Melainabacteria bacterium]
MPTFAFPKIFQATSVAATVQGQPNGAGRSLPLREPGIESLSPQDSSLQSSVPARALWATDAVRFSGSRDTSLLTIDDAVDPNAVALVTQYFKRLPDSFINALLERKWTVALTPGSPLDPEQVGQYELECGPFSKKLTVFTPNPSLLQLEDVLSQRLGVSQEESGRQASQLLNGIMEAYYQAFPYEENPSSSSTYNSEIKAFRRRLTDEHALEWLTYQLNQFFQPAHTAEQSQTFSSTQKPESGLSQKTQDAIWAALACGLADAANRTFDTAPQKGLLARTFDFSGKLSDGKGFKALITPQNDPLTPHKEQKVDSEAVFLDVAADLLTADDPFNSLAQVEPSKRSLYEQVYTMLNLG